jgi:hypothetical protein
MLTVILSIINFFSGSAFQGIVSAVTGVVGKLSDDKAAEFTAAAGAEQAVLVARMQADSQAYQARIGLYRGMFWLQIVLMLAYVGPVWHSPLVYLDSCPFLPLFTGNIGLSWRRPSSARGTFPRFRATTAPKSGRPSRRCLAFKPLPLAASCIFLHK